MSQSTGPIVTLGLITWANGAILSPQPGRNQLDFAAKVAVGTGIAAGGLALVERISPELAKGVAWVALITALFTRIGGRKSPVDNLLSWYEKAR
jgi:hypothetical protein